MPVHSVRLLHSRGHALGYPRRDIALGFCSACGFISNVCFDPSAHDYSSEYEASQAYSPTFNAFAQRLAERLVRDYDLHGKTIIEIGCGQGEFLNLLCDLGDNRGIGFDPAYIRGRQDLGASERTQVIKDYYSERYAEHHADLVVCKMTLEHISEPARFVRTVRRSLQDRFDTTVFFQVPDVRRILTEGAFWDIYYEHCSYFSAGSLARLFRRSGFDVLRLAREYDDQYLMIEARPARAEGSERESLDQDADLDDVRDQVATFAAHVQPTLDRWRDDIRGAAARGERAVIWGSGSKGVAFLTTLGIESEIRYAVDINPNKAGTYMAGTGQEIVPPEFMTEYRPDQVIVMNPVYCGEIRESLQSLGLAPRLLSV